MLTGVRMETRWQRNKILLRKILSVSLKQKKK